MRTISILFILDFHLSNCSFRSSVSAVHLSSFLSLIVGSLPWAMTSKRGPNSILARPFGWMFVTKCANPSYFLLAALGCTALIPPQPKTLPCMEGLLICYQRQGVTLFCGRHYSIASENQFPFFMVNLGMTPESAYSRHLECIYTECTVGF